jgi:hypothetical protein
LSKSRQGGPEDLFLTALGKAWNRLPDFRNQHDRSIDDARRQRLVSGCGDCQPTAAMPAGERRAVNAGPRPIGLTGMLSMREQADSKSIPSVYIDFSVGLGMRLCA